jgi:DNA-binding PadR family transcriptional regulator
MNHQLLIHQNPIIFTPDLARIIGVNAAIIIQKLEFLLEIPKNGKEFDGEKWIYNTYGDWQKDFFPFWSTRTIRRIFGELEEIAFVASCQPEGRGSRDKYYRITETGRAILNTKNLPDSLPCGNEEGGQVGQGGVDKLAASCARASIESESRTESIEAKAFKTHFKLDDKRPRKLSPPKRKPFDPPTKDECKAYAFNKGYPESDGEDFWYSWETHEWKVGNTNIPLRNWKANFDKRAHNKWLPSQSRGNLVKQY